MIEGCFPTDGKGYAVALRAFLDGSEQKGVFTVAGFAFGLSRSKKAQKKWNKLHGGRVLHMTDLHGRFGDFEGMDPKDAGDLLKGSVEIISGHMKFGVAASCDVSDIYSAPNIAKTGDHLIDTLSGGFGSPYAWCCHIAMHTIGSLVRLAGVDSNCVNYVFECGDAGQGKVKEFVRFVEDYPAPILRDDYCMNTAVFASKDGQEVLLQSGDVFSWEWSRHINRKREGKHVRPSLKALFGGFEEAPRKYGVTAYSHEHGRVMASHYEGETWKESYSELCQYISDEGKPAGQELSELARSPGRMVVSARSNLSSASVGFSSPAASMS